MPWILNSPGLCGVMLSGAMGFGVVRKDFCELARKAEAGSLSNLNLDAEPLLGNTTRASFSLFGDISVAQWLLSVDGLGARGTCLRVKLTFLGVAGFPL